MQKSHTHLSATTTPTKQSLTEKTHHSKSTPQRSFDDSRICATSAFTPTAKLTSFLLGKLARQLATFELGSTKLPNVWKSYYREPEQHA